MIPKQLWALLLIGGSLVSCRSPQAEPTSRRVVLPSTRDESIQSVPAIDPPALSDDKPREYPGLRNVVAYHENFYSGSAPEGDAGFDVLVGLGIRTIISVDGTEPEVKYAHTRGMRYIHLPIGYNGFDEQRKLELVRAARDALQAGPVYLHCHHGKHRSAGAAGAIAASLGWMTPESATARMKVSGTAAEYKGLYACAAGATLLAADVINSAPANYPEVSHPPTFVKAMIEIDDIHDHLHAIEKAAWTTPPDHPDLVPVAEAGRMADLFRFLSESEKARSKPPDFGTRLQADSARAQTLEDLLAATDKDNLKLSEQLKLLGKSCKDCHAAYRD